MAQLSVPQICLALLACWFLFKLMRTTRKAIFTPLHHIPGPRYASWTNLWLKIQVMRGNRCQYIHSIHERYGPFVRVSPDEIAVADLASIKQIYRVGTNFLKSPWYQKFNESPHPGIFSMIDAKEHATRRRLFAQSFSKTSLGRFETQIRKKVDTAVSKIDRDMKVDKADILKWFTFMATDVIGELSFGESFNMLEGEMVRPSAFSARAPNCMCKFLTLDRQKNPYIVDLETAMMVSGSRVELGPFFRIAKFLPVAAIQNALTLGNRMSQYGMAAIENHKKHVMQSSDKEAASLFSKFLDPTKNQELSLAEISEEASNLIVAGSDTTAISLTYLVWSLLRPQHQSIKRKLLAEIADLPVNISAAELDRLKYLNAVIKESLRLYGAAPGSLPRICPPGGAQLGRYVIPEGTTVSTQAYTVHRNESIFEKPER
ncbi:hypothetical protein H2200_010829 [Cladophialophora chaetospira]|uniref:Cytochrome P450 n=1 Tax=Cladophialophora chaetospira TaxID=386627 RepID=A0AA39CDU6_9EURO|nr:hypothetical protein H2200_010829 [Cladophialophora chaetospira]